MPDEFLFLNTNRKQKLKRQHGPVRVNISWPACVVIVVDIAAGVIGLYAKAPSEFYLFLLAVLAYVFTKTLRTI